MFENVSCWTSWQMHLSSAVDAWCRKKWSRPLQQRSSIKKHNYTDEVRFIECQSAQDVYIASSLERPMTHRQLLMRGILLTSSISTTECNERCDQNMQIVFQTAAKIIDLNVENSRLYLQNYTFPVWPSTLHTGQNSSRVKTAVCKQKQQISVQESKHQSSSQSPGG